MLRRIQKLLKEYLRPLTLALRLSLMSGRYWVLLKFFLIGVQALIPLAALYVLKLLIDSFTDNTGPLDELFLNESIQYVIALGSLGIFGVIISGISQLVNEKQSFLLQDYISEIVNAKSLSLDLAYYENPSYLDSFQRAQSEAASRPAQVLENWTGLVRNGISLVGILSYLVFLNWVVALVLFCASVPAFIIKIKYSEIMFQWQLKTTQTARESQYLRYLMTAPENVKEMRIFDMGSKVLRKFRKILKHLRDERLKIMKVTILQSSLAKTGEIIAITGALGYLALNTLEGKLTIGDLVIYHQAFQKGQTNLQGFLRQIAALYDHRKFLVNLTDFLDLDTTTSKVSHISNVPITSLIHSPIKFENLDFSYQGQQNPALSNVNLVIQTNELITIIGANGSGKSTFIKLLSKLYDPSSGHIIIGDTDLSHIDKKEWQSQISVTFQDFNKYNFSLAENVAIVPLGEKIDYDRLEKVCEATGVNDFIDKLPEGYESLLGRKFFGGVELSQGQWQRIAIARTLYQKSPIIIFDEPTAALDPAMEIKLFKLLREEATFRTVIIVSHRVLAAQMSDKVMLIDKGRIIAYGEHNALHIENRHYRDLYDQQARLLHNKEVSLKDR